MCVAALSCGHTIVPSFSRVARHAAQYSCPQSSACGARSVALKSSRQTGQVAMAEQHELVKLCVRSNKGKWLALDLLSRLPGLHCYGIGKGETSKRGCM